MTSCCSGQTAAEAKQERPRWEVADIFREYCEDYRREHALPPSAQNVMKNIEACRTAQLGGHLDRCTCCDHERPSYNSCRDRHCPKCQTMNKARWLESRRRELLPVPYFHAVFAPPHELNPITLCNKKVIYSILFKTVSETIQKFAKAKGGKIGLLAILHTWNQTLLDHAHLHCLIPAGMLSLDGERWIPFNNEFLFPIKALSKVFQGKFIDYLKKSFADGKLTFPGKTAEFGTQEGFSRLLDQLWGKNWVVYCKPPLAGPEKVLDYLARYTHRVAIANHRIVDVKDGKVSFEYKDRKHDNRRKVMTLKAEEFIRRFLLHILPAGFVRIRHYGFLANCCKKANLEQCSKLLGFEYDASKPVRKNFIELMLELTGKDITRCLCCGKGTMRQVAVIAPVLLGYTKSNQPQPQILDSS